MGEFAWPFGLGIFAAFNPCGFAMLPAYLSFFLGIESQQPPRSRLATAVRGLGVGMTMTLGFVAVFGTFGILFATVINRGTVLDVVPYVIIAIGVFMIPLGVAMLMGKQVTLRLPKMAKGTGSRDLTSVFMFGVSYAIVSLSCTIGIFIPAISNSFTSDGIAQGTGNFLAYAIGMGMVITFLTMSLALAKSEVAGALRRVLPYITPISGVMLIVAGLYMIDYGIWDYQVTIAGNVGAGNLMVDQFLEFQEATTVWIQDTTTERIGLISLFGILGVLLIGWRDDVDDPLKRRSVTAAYIAALVGVEIYNNGEFIVRPLLRFLTGWPERVVHWFTDPLRFGVPLEIAFVAAVGWIVWRSVARYRPQHARGVVGAT